MVGYRNISVGCVKVEQRLNRCLSVMVSRCALFQRYPNTPLSHPPALKWPRCAGGFWPEDKGNYNQSMNVSVPINCSSFGKREPAVCTKFKDWRKVDAVVVENKQVLRDAAATDCREFEALRPIWTPSLGLKERLCI